MSKFNVNGWVKETNKVIEIQIEADTSQHAEETAEKMGISVSNVSLIRSNRLKEIHPPDTPSPTSRIAFVLLGILLYLLLGIGGIHNLVAGFTAKGIAQLVISIVNIPIFILGLFLGVPLCLSIPIWLGLLIWIIVESCTVKLDAQGRLMS